MPKQIYLFSVGINTYTLYIGLALLAGIATALWATRGSIERFSRTLTGLLIIGVCAMVAGRAGYALLHFDYFSEHWTEMISTASPGMWEQTAIIGAVSGWWIAKRLSRPVSAMALTFMAGFVGIGASLGCIPHGCAYGREVFWTDGWVWALRADWPDAYTLNNPRLPTQVFMIAWLLLVMLVTVAPKVKMIARRQALTSARGFGGKEGLTHASAVTSWDGAALATWIALFAVGDFVIQMIRADAQQTIAGLRWSQCADAVLFAVSMLYWIVVKIRLSIKRR